MEGEKRKIVIYFAGGTMSGIFGVGVAMAFQKKNIYPHIKAIYGSSAGIPTGAYFLSRQSKKLATIYWEEAAEKFISKKNFFIGFFQRFIKRFLKFVPGGKMRDALNFEYLINAVNHRKPFDKNMVINQDIPLFAKLFDIDRRKIDFVDVRNGNIIKIIKIGIRAFPYVSKIIPFNKKRYVDAGILDVIGLESLKERHPNDRIILVINGSQKSSIIDKIKQVFGGKFMEWMFDDPILFKLHLLVEDNFTKDISDAKKDSLVSIISPPKKLNFGSITTNPKKLKKAYRAGIRKGRRKIIKILKNL